jgi:UDP-N-acetylmuramoylalanine--D-glutamate ligase
VHKHLKEIKANKFSFGDEVVSQGAYIDKESIKININSEQVSMTIHELALQGKHNCYNSMASGIAAKLLGITNDIVRDSLSNFEKIEHRLESVLKVHGVNYINDSKATNINSVWYALESMNNPVVWICGGVDKGNDYQELFPLVKNKVKAIVCLGRDNSKLLTTFSPIVEQIKSVNSMEDAVKTAYKYAENGDVVLLSPACASFDLFDTYEDRGRQFKKQIRLL